MSNSRYEYWTFMEYLNLCDELKGSYPDLKKYNEVFIDLLLSFSKQYKSKYEKAGVYHMGMKKSGIISDIEYDWYDIYHYIDFDDGTSGCYYFSEFKYEYNFL